MRVERTPIEEARELIEACILLISTEQQTFATMRIRTDLSKAIECLSALQTVALPPVTHDLSEIDEGEPSSYEWREPAQEVYA